MIIDETLKLNLNVGRALSLVHLVEPLLQRANLIEALDVDGELLEARRHKPLYLLVPKVPDNQDDKGDAQKNHYDMPTHIIDLHENSIQTDPKVDA